VTRKPNLSPVPDAPASGVDVAELRRNLAPAAPAALHAVQPVSAASASTESLSRLQRLRSAKQAAVEQLAELDETITRAEAALGRTQVAKATMSAIENEVAEATRRWIADGARGDAPTLSAAQRQALEAARADFADAQRQAATVEQSLEMLRGNRGQLARAIAQADQEIRTVAAAIVAADGCALLAELREKRDAVRTLERRLMGLRDQLPLWGMGLSGESYALNEAFPKTTFAAPAATDEDRREWADAYVRLLANQEG
jgi:DNA repair exonuclease SbcCD ATPase subunit